MSIPLIPTVILLSFSVFSSILLIGKGDNRTCQMKFLGGTLLIYTLFFLIYVLWFEFGLIIKYPHLLRSFSPVMFLAGPLLYFSIRNNVFGLPGFKKKDWVHFFPAVIHFLELIPLYSLSSSEKLQIVRKVISEQNGLNIYAQGFLPSIWVDFFRFVLLISYFSYSVYLVFRSNPDFFEKLKQKKFKNWLFGTLIFFGIIHVFFLGLYIQNIQFYFTGVFYPSLRTVLVVLMLLSILAYNIYNFFSWELSLNLSGETPPFEKKPVSLMIREHNSTIVNFPSPKYLEEQETVPNQEEIREKLNRLLNEDQIFLKQGLRVNDFAMEIGISARCLPVVLENIYGGGFKDLINLYRVRYAKEKIEMGYLDLFTLDSLGKEAGFSSRTTFYNAFKKELKISPSDFWKRFQEGPSQP